MTIRSLKRFLNPKSIALFGGGWSENVIQQLLKSGYQGNIWPVHPKRDEIIGIKCFANVDALPEAPDAAFIGVNREITYDVVRDLSKAGSGGAICFASGFRESESDKAATGDRQDLLVEAAGEMPLLGPNCYGFINYLDNISLWPDQHGAKQCENGVAIIAQSSNIAINMTMQQRGLNIAYMITAGNQAQTGVSDLVEAVLGDERVSAIGLYLESFNDIRAFERMAKHARELGKSIVALKIGKSLKAQIATVTHTASLAGNAASSTAFLKRLGIIEVDSIAVFLETLKLIDQLGSLTTGSSVASVSCSGGEASLISDLAMHSQISFDDFNKKQIRDLAEVLGSKVTVANPLDYHTYIWGDVPKMTQCFTAVMSDTFDLVVFVLDLPRKDKCDASGHDCAIEAIIAAKKATDVKVAVITSLSENLDEIDSQRFIDAGIVPLHGMEEAITAIDKSILAGRLLQNPTALPVLLVPQLIENDKVISLDEYQAKLELAKYGLNLPRSATANSKDKIVGLASHLNYPLVLKGLGFEHKTESGAVILGIDSLESLQIAITKLPDCEDGYLLEEMAEKAVAELIIGVTRDELGMFLMTIGAGGIYTELLADTVSVLLPSTHEEIIESIQELKIYQILKGYRGQASANIESIVSAVMTVSAFVEKNQTTLKELDINPLFAGSHSAIAVDALIRRTEKGNIE